MKDDDKHEAEEEDDYDAIAFATASGVYGDNHADVTVDDTIDDTTDDTVEAFREGMRKLTAEEGAFGFVPGRSSLNIPRRGNSFS